MAIRRLSGDHEMSGYRIVELFIPGTGMVAAGPPWVGTIFRFVPRWNAISAPSGDQAMSPPNGARTRARMRGLPVAGLISAIVVVPRWGLDTVASVAPRGAHAHQIRAPLNRCGGAPARSAQSPLSGGHGELYAAGLQWSYASQRPSGDQRPIMQVVHGTSTRVA